MPTSDALEVLFSSFLEEYQEEINARMQLISYFSYFYFYEMSTETFEFLYKFCARPNMVLQIGAFGYRVPNKEIIGVLTGQYQGIIVSIPIVQSELPKGKAILRRTGCKET